MLSIPMNQTFPWVRQRTVITRAAGAGPYTRLSELSRSFESEVEGSGRFQFHHPHIVPLLVYYFARVEKLLMSDQACMVPLQFHLNSMVSQRSLNFHGFSGEFSKPSPPLKWAAKMKISRGLVFAHDYSPRKHIHEST